MDAKDKVDVVNRYIAAMDAADIEVIRSLYADNATLEDPAGADPVIGLAAVTQFYEEAFKAGVKLVATGKPRCAGNAVVFPFRAELPDRKFEIIDLFEFNAAGKIFAMKAYWGPENMLG